MIMTHYTPQSHPHLPHPRVKQQHMAEIESDAKPLFSALPFQSHIIHTPCNTLKNLKHVQLFNFYNFGNLDPPPKKKKKPKQVILH